MRQWPTTREEDERDTHPVRSTWDFRVSVEGNRKVHFDMPVTFERACDLYERNKYCTPEEIDVISEGIIGHD